MDEGVIGGLPRAGTDVDVDAVRPGSAERGGFGLVGGSPVVGNICLAVHRDAARLRETVDGLQRADRQHRHPQAHPAQDHAQTPAQRSPVSQFTNPRRSFNARTPRFLAAARRDTDQPWTLANERSLGHDYGHTAAPCQPPTVGLAGMRGGMITMAPRGTQGLAELMVDNHLLPSRSEADGTHRRLLEVALLTFGERGFHGVSVRELAAAAGIQPSSMYAHLASKEALLMELVMLGHEEHRDRLRAARDTVSGDAIEEIPALVHPHAG